MKIVGCVEQSETYQATRPSVHLVPLALLDTPYNYC